MDNASAAGSNPHPAQAPAAAHQGGLVRVDQVDKLPHLTDAQKSTHKNAVQTLWDTLNSHPQNSREYMSAQTKLSQISQTLLKDVRMFQQRQQQLQQQRAQQQQMQQGQQSQQQGQHQGQQQGQQAQGQQAQQSQQQQPQMSRPAQQGGATQTAQSRGPAMGVPQSFQQLLPQIQAKVNTLNFVLPPRITDGPADHWLEQAKLRYGLALQKQEFGKLKLNEARQAYQQRAKQGNMTQDEIQDFKNRQVNAEKLYREGSNFLSEFKEQQEQFRKEQHEGQQGGAANAPDGQRQGQPASAEASRPQTATTDHPAPHTISSAVDAARHQAEQAHAQQAQGQNQAGATQQPSSQQQHQSGQPTPQQTPQQPLQQTQQPQTQAMQHPQQPPAQHQGAPQQPQQQQAPFSQATHQQQRPYPQGQQPQEGSVTMASSQSQGGGPRPMSQQAAMSQAAQSQQSMAAQAAQAASSHAHPAGLSRNDTGSRNVTMQIPKNLNVPAPEPVTMGAARPTLTAGASHGSAGQMAQPAIQRHPGYVLEGDGQRVLSKKALDTLVRQVTGGGEGNGLTPDAEEFVLQMADDFVDEVITAACRLAKLRPSSTLDIRDIQLVLERNYNIRIPGFSSDDLRTVKKPHPTSSWTQKMSAVQAAKVTQARID